MFSQYPNLCRNLSLVGIFGFNFLYSVLIYCNLVLREFALCKTLKLPKKVCFLEKQGSLMQVGVVKIVKRLIHWILAFLTSCVYIVFFISLNYGHFINICFTVCFFLLHSHFKASKFIILRLYKNFVSPIILFFI